MSIAQAVFPVTLKLGCFSVIRSPSLSCEQRCLAYYILQWSPIFVTSCISGHYWMKLLYSRPTKQPPTFLKNTASSAHYDMANDIPSGHLLCCNFPLVWHAPPSADTFYCWAILYTFETFHPHLQKTDERSCSARQWRETTALCVETLWMSL